MGRFFEKKKKLKITLLSVLFFIVVLVGGFYIYTLDYYRATDEVDKMEEFQNAEKMDNMSVFYPNKGESLNKGIIFYPGGKVEAKAYAPLLIKLTQEGYTCVLIKMPFNLAVFNIKAADKVYDEVSDIDEWYLMGHSLGGAMASSYCDKNSEKLDGLILLGAYPLNDADIETLTIYGTEDLGQDMNELQEKYDAVLIEGGNHAYYGNYGEQKGDGIAKITRQQQQETAVKLITEFIGSR